MRILIVNYRYFVSGGPETYLFKVSDLLEEDGHDVVPFSITYDANLPNRWADYFAPPIGDAGAVYFRDQRRDVRTYLRTIERSVYSPTVYRCLARLIRHAKPDVAYLIHYMRKLSPAVLACLADHGIPAAAFLSDFGMVCPNAHLLRDDAPCELCVGGSQLHSVRHACVQGSHAASLVNYLATQFHRSRGYFDFIDTFVAPSEIMRLKMIEGGFDSNRIVHIPMFVPSDPGPHLASVRPATVVFVGRMEHIKGVHTLLQAVEILNRDATMPEFQARLIGDGEAAYVAGMQRIVRDSRLENVTFEGWQSRAEVARALRNARCSVVPSLWYENAPNSALESMAAGTPIVAPDQGCFPELVTDGDDGALYTPADPSALASCLRRFIVDAHGAARMGRRAFTRIEGNHSPQSHREALMGVLTKLDVRKNPVQRNTPIQV